VAEAEGQRVGQDDAVAHRSTVMPCAHPLLP
jgi:hypothetical protein